MLEEIAKWQKRKLSEIQSRQRREGVFDTIQELNKKKQINNNDLMHSRNNVPNLRTANNSMLSGNVKNVNSSMVGSDLSSPNLSQIKAKPSNAMELPRSNSSSRAGVV